MVGQPSPLPFWLETLSIFLGDVAAVLFIGSVTFLLWYFWKYPGFHVRVEWTLDGWDSQHMGRLPNESDSGTVDLFPNISVTSYDRKVQKIVAAVWVQERADETNPGMILGRMDLEQSGLPSKERTTGKNSSMSFVGPRIPCPASKAQKYMNFPVFVRTSDGELYPAESANAPKGIRRKLRYRGEKVIRAAKQWILGRLGT
jgi:hypothetical protein